MRIQTMLLGMGQAMLLMACERAATNTDYGSGADAAGQSANEAKDEARAIALRTAAEPEVTLSAAPAPASGKRQWSPPFESDPATRLIVRTGQASI